MSLTQDHGNIVFECDGKDCREMMDTGTSNFDAALSASRLAGWHPRKPPGFKEWLHLCGDCYAQVFVTLNNGQVV